MERPIFYNGGIYHVYNRGVEKRDIFLNNADYFRFVHDLFEFNDESPAENLYYKQKQIQSYEVEPRKIDRRVKREERRCFVEIMVFCIMRNHYHLILRQKVDGGITEFMRKIGTGYSMYFNKKYERVGGLFQGTFKAIPVETDMYFQHLIHYIHCNPLDFVAPEWRDQNLNDATKAIQFLESYRWSSYLDYIGKKNFPSITQRDFILEIFGGSERYKKGTINLLSEMQKKLEDLHPLFLE